MKRLCDDCRASQKRQTSLTPAFSPLKSRILEHFALPANWRDLLDPTIFPSVHALEHHWASAVDSDMEIDSPSPTLTPSNSSGNLNRSVTPSLTPVNSSGNLQHHQELLLTPASSAEDLYPATSPFDEPHRGQGIVEYDDHMQVSTNDYSFATPADLREVPPMAGPSTKSSLPRSTDASNSIFDDSQPPADELHPGDAMEASPTTPIALPAPETPFVPSIAF